jgi:hypothetical protein
VLERGFSHFEDRHEARLRVKSEGEEVAFDNFNPSGGRDGATNQAKHLRKKNQPEILYCKMADQEAKRQHLLQEIARYAGSIVAELV